MAFLALLALAGIGWLWWKGYLGPDAGRKLGLVAGMGLSLWLLGRGQVWPGLGLAAATAGLGFAGWMRRRVSVLPMDEIEARQLLGVGLNAGRAEILAAHRKRIAEVHPDRNQGGGDAMAGRVNAARDYLLANLPPDA
ncbi:hypothetical protein L6Q21_15325 [Sandaracinobacter sp. RS1-74]|uniref:J domain-containing protein n=1 Tax=Sandaracinobacteroides sayramensis TaxID=2913411 RepID=UPI001EDAFF56|nr:hypothetical protein [Sandaracinobacteroides sayramensis]MCG2842348.1 hypothetical protein [Sandaracinobacteroides sayramensis]